jgi:hypothetical protein
MVDEPPLAIVVALHVGRVVKEMALPCDLISL